ncbi:hypothetical protein CEXT_57851 [Caerostris extrusa]|uniref:Uncharacterized protein n=1 Tax=Caerostris extrusa TaxID=172846 RepID=A0AAV4Y0T7_CAEEX|nr:hypothetical protein CEXT_57851 [Caerostris extrusa]
MRHLAEFYTTKFIKLERLLETTRTFLFTPRTERISLKVFLKTPGVPYFLDSYVHPEVPLENPLSEHIAAAMKDVMKTRIFYWKITKDSE